MQTAQVEDQKGELQSPGTIIILNYHHLHKAAVFLDALEVILLRISSCLFESLYTQWSMYTEVYVYTLGPKALLF